MVREVVTSIMSFNAGQQEPGHVLGRIVAAGGDSARPDFLLQFAGTTEFRLGGLQIGKLSYTSEARVQILTK